MLYCYGDAAHVALQGAVILLGGALHILLRKSRVDWAVLEMVYPLFLPNRPVLTGLRGSLSFEVLGEIDIFVVLFQTVQVGGILEGGRTIL